MIEIKVSGELKSYCPNYVGAAILAEIKNSEHNLSLWEEIDTYATELRSTLKIEDIRHNNKIAATREAYKALGKEPNRYRPSAEALQRRILRELPLYQINTAVDVINLISIKTGYSIGGFDYNKIEGYQLVLGVGKADEPFDAIGRGQLNIEGLPVYRDELGAIGTPTSDDERTKLSLKTTRLLMLINAYSGEDGLKEAIEDSKALLEKYTDATIIKTLIY